MKKNSIVVNIYALFWTQIKVSIIMAVLQEMSEEQNSSSEIFLRDIVICVNDEEEIMQSIKETSEVEIPKEMY